VRKRWIVALMVVAATSAACGGGDDGSASGGEAAAAPDEAEQELLAFAQCMRDNGIDMPDPEPGGGIVALETAPADGGPSDADFQRAEEACSHLLPEGMGPTDEKQTELQDAFLAFTECMRDNGIEMPDPEFEDGGGFSVEIGDEGGAGPDFEDPKFQAAQKKCSHLLPNFGAPPGDGGS
jgi:hypothetical protein